MRWIYLLPFLALSVAGCVTTPEHEDEGEDFVSESPTDFLEQAVVGPNGDGTYVVPTTQLIDPAGETILFPGRPVNIVRHPAAPVLAVKGKADVILIDAGTRAILQTMPLPRDGSSFNGLVWNGDGSSFWVTSSKRYLHRASRQEGGAYAWDLEVELPGPGGKGDCAPGGIALDEKRGLAFVCLSRNNTIGVIDIATAKVVEEISVGVAPFDIKIQRDFAFVTNWGGSRPGEGVPTSDSSGTPVAIDERGIANTGSITVIQLQQVAAVKVKDGTSAEVVAEMDTHVTPMNEARGWTSFDVPVGLHPSGMALSPDGGKLYVANANSDTISVLNAAAVTPESLAVADTWIAKPKATLPFGSAPNALAVSADGKTLYAALGGNNCIAVMSTKDGAVQGLIPTGWYPGALAFDAASNQLYVANTKGVGSRFEESEVVAKRLKDYQGGEVPPGTYLNSHSHLGSVSFIPVPGREELADYTLRVAENMRLPLIEAELGDKRPGTRETPVPTRPGEVSPFKHVFYIIKENRTYDQVFGDLPQGKGDPNLCHFPREVTPNHHALAEEFVLLDNFYCNGVLSADGHQWVAEGYVTDYIEKQFGGFTRSYPYDGDDALAYASSGFIWDQVLAKGLTFRNYGEMVKATITPSDATWAQIYEQYKNGGDAIKIEASAHIPRVQQYLCPDFIGFPGKVQDVYRAKIFLKEFAEFEKAGNLPNFITMLLPNDHTSGTREDMPTPRACVADNDLALGQIVDAITHSSYWPESVIFVVEDDPQAGLDHVDGHRTVALCISPYTRRGQVVSKHYNQSSMLRTMELILGLDPVNQLTLAANPMTDCFNQSPDLTPYTVRPNTIPLDEMNPPVSATRGLQRHYAKQSMKMPLDDIDEADEGLFNRVLWHSVKGYDVPYPVLRRE
ncbi:MAG: bifunctional YncE family protein/alkaline phosphatase family protein [Candidatus Hydrogenedentes bacterium]|nr:bifunctional YncE family protein/alkaline phosphatase family protein [Candidatus Hydrogenedentota bacterium]